MQTLEFNPAYLLGFLLLLCGCSKAPTLITNGTVTVQIPHSWKASKDAAGQILIETNFKAPLFSSLRLPTETISIRSHPTCLSDNVMAQAKSNATRNLLGRHATSALWNEVKTKSAPLSCLISEKAAIGNLPNNLMFCISKDGVEAVYGGESSEKPKAIEILKSIKTNVACPTSKD